jgi:phage host-nuclease inhibitor protein Gam
VNVNFQAKFPGLALESNSLVGELVANFFLGRRGRFFLLRQTETKKAENGEMRWYIREASMQIAGAEKKSRVRRFEESPFKFFFRIRRNAAVVATLSKQI